LSPDTVPSADDQAASGGSRVALGVVLWLAGMVGVVAFSLLPLPHGLTDRPLRIPLWLIETIGLVQSGVTLAVAVAIGTRLAPRVGLAAPAFEALVARGSVLRALRPQVVPGIVGGLLAAGAGSGGLAVLGLVGGFATMMSGAIARVTGRAMERPPLAALRRGPAALPASDPYVARMGALLGDTSAPDVRERIAELALLLQRLCDHRRATHGADAALSLVTEPLGPLVDVIERIVRALIAIDAGLAEVDEGAIVRAIASSQARKEPPSARDDLLAGLDRLRSLEDRRAAELQRLLEASSLLHRIVALGLAEHDEVRDHEMRVREALAALGAGAADSPDTTD
jgi:hypothetical protein